MDMSSYIQFNLCESQSMVPLHISIRFQYSVVVRNSHQFNSWEKEEKHGPFPFRLGQDFLVEISVQSDGYQISVDGRPCWNFSHRLSYLKSTRLHIAGPVRIEWIEYTHRKERGQPGSWKQSSTILKPIFNPTVPFLYPITGGIKCGMMISISGKPLSKFHRLTIDLQCGSTVIPPPDIAFHFDACAFNSTVVRNTRHHEQWEDEETAAPYFPFKPDTPFNMIIKIQNDKYIVKIDGQDFVNYYHRMSRFSLINTLKIDHDISVASIEFDE